MGKGFFEQKKVTATLAIIPFISGFFFLNKSMTGNAIITKTTNPSILSLIGILLILCSLILGAYSLKK